MVDHKKLFVLTVAWTLLFVPADLLAVKDHHTLTSKQTHHTEEKVLHIKEHNHYKTGKQKKASTEGEHIGIFTAYTGTPKKRGRSHRTADSSSLKGSSCTLANNSLPFGTKVFIKGIGTCTVHDRMGRKKGYNRFDIHLNDNHKWAKNFGKRKLKYKVLS